MLVVVIDLIYGHIAVSLKQAILINEEGSIIKVISEWYLRLVGVSPSCGVTVTPGSSIAISVVRIPDAIKPHYHVALRILELMVAEDGVGVVGG